MKTLSLITRYLRRLFSYYITGKKACLIDMIRLEEEVYQDFGSLYNKQLGLPVKRYKAGVRDKNIENDIRDGACLIIKRLAEIRDDLFSYCYPDTTLISIYRNVYKLENILASAPIGEIIDCLDKILAIGDNFYARHFKIARFDLDKLLEQIVAAFQKSQNDKVILKLILANARYQLRLPYADYANWLRMFRNIIINAIEAVELSGKLGRVEVQLSYPDKTSARVEIIDNGIGMDQATLTNFARRGFTSGKQSGQGLGVNEDTVLFLEKNGGFKAVSVPGEGTAITIDIDSTKDTNGQLGAQLVSPAGSRELRVAGITAILSVICYLIFSIPFTQLRFWLPPEIYHCELINPMPDRPSGYRGIAALDKDLQRLWELDFSPYFFSKSEPFGMTKPIVEDVNNDNRNEIVLSLQTTTLFSPADNASVICLTDNKRELWRYQLGPNPPRPIFGIPQHEEGTFTTTLLRAFDFPELGRVICAIAVPSLYPSQMVFLNGSGEKIGEYWHTGVINIFDSPNDFDNDGVDEIVLYGINNRLGWGPMITMIEPNNLTGQSRPYIDSLFPRAKEEAYYIFGHAWICDGPGYLESGEGKYYSSMSLNNVVIMGAALKRISGPGGFRYEFYTTDGRTICFDHNFNLGSIIVDSIEFTRWWNERKKTVLVNRNWDNEDLRQLYGYRKYIRGELATDSISLYPERYDYINYWAAKIR